MMNFLTLDPSLSFTLCDPLRKSPRILRYWLRKDVTVGCHWQCSLLSFLVDWIGLNLVLYIIALGKWFVRFFCLPKKKNQKKGQANPNAPQVLPSQRTTILTTGGKNHFEYRLSLRVFTSIHIVWVWKIEHVLCEKSKGWIAEGVLRPLAIQ